MLLSPGEKIIHKSRDAYGDLIVTDSDLFRTLYFGSISKQSSMFLERPDVLTLRYTQVMAAALIFQPQPLRILILGIGGASLVRFLLKSCPAARIDAVELREAVIRLAYGYFCLPENEPRLNVICQDGLQFVREAEPDQYDLIMLDVYDRQGPVTEFLEWDFLQNCRLLLRPEGVLCANLWNRQTDDFKQRYRGFRAVFNKQTLRYALDKKNGNALVFAFHKAPKLKELEDQARDFKRLWGLDGPQYLATMHSQNSGFWR